MTETPATVMVLGTGAGRQLASRVMKQRTANVDKTPRALQEMDVVSGFRL